MRNTVAIALLTIGILATTTAANARRDRSSDITVTTGFGDGFQVKHGLFGQKTTEIKDRLGDGYQKKKGLFGSKETNVNLLGNTFHKKRGWIGGTEVSAGDLLGDRIVSQKRWLGLGRRRTSVDLSGASSLVQQFLGSRNRPTERLAPGLTPGFSPQSDLSQSAGMSGLPADSTENLDRSAGLSP